jgi:hypothetical protein
MTEEHKASRTIVKSPPELWAECSVAQSLARHLGEFGEIRITRLEPETTVAWEGEHASGTVRLEPSGWGTQVTLTATPIAVAAPEPAVEPAPEPEPEPVAVEAEPEPVQEADDAEDAGEDDAEPAAAEHVPRWQVFARLWGRLGRKPVAVEPEEAEAQAEAKDDSIAVAVPEEPEAVAEERCAATEEPEAAAEEPATVEEPAIDHQALLVGALDSLGQAHHRPFSRA